MPSDDELLAAIFRKPDDDAPRLAYADVLSARGDPRGEFIRVQCALARHNHQDGTCRPLHDREKELLLAHYAEWTASLGDLTEKAKIFFERGFLESFSLHDDEGDGVLQEITKLPHLRDITLSKHVTDAGLAYLAPLKLVQALWANQAHITDDGIPNLLQLKSLRRLDLEGTQVTPSGALRLQELPRLIDGRFGERFDPDVRRAIRQARMTRFHALSRRERRSEAIEALGMLGSSRTDEKGKLKVLDCGQCRFTDEDLEYVTAVPEIEEIDLHQSDITETGLRHLSSLSRLKALNISETNVRTLKGLRGLRRLKKLVADFLTTPDYEPALTDEGTAGLETLIGLKWLSLGGEPPLGTGTLQRIGNLRKLRYLRLSDVTELTPDGIAALSELSRLEELYMYGATVRDEDLKVLSRCSRLKVLTLGGQPITDEGLQHLTVLRKLELLELDGTEVNVDAAERFLNHAPKAAIRISGSIVKRTVANPVFVRREVDEQFSVAVPRHWPVSRWEVVQVREKEQFDGWISEDGFEHIFAYGPGSQPGEVHVFRVPTEQTALDFLQSRLFSLSAKPGEISTALVAGCDGVELAACQYQSSNDRGILAVWTRQGTGYGVQGSTSSERFAQLQPWFNAIAGSGWFAEAGPPPKIRLPGKLRPPKERSAGASPEERALLEAILAAPDSDEPRLAYADWLERNSDPRAELIRLQCRRESSSGSERAGLDDQVNSLMAAYQSQWLGPAHAVGLESPVFKRGFVEEGTITVSRFLKNPERVFESFPLLRSLTFRDSKNRIGELARCPALSRLVELNVSYLLQDADAAELIVSPHLGNLTSLDLMFNDLGPRSAQALASAERLSHLETLNLWSTGISDEGAAAIAQGPQFANLCELSMHFCNLGPAGATALGNSRTLRRLERFRACHNQMGEEGLAAILRSPHLESLSLLELTSNGIGDEGLIALAESPHSARLRCLFMGWENSYTDAGMAALAQSPHLGELLQLEVTPPGPAGLEAILSSTTLSSLRFLSATNSNAGAELVRWLDRSPLLDHLTWLDLGGSGLGDEAVRDLVSNPRLKNLTRLSLRGNPFGDVGLQAVLESPNLEQLTRIDLRDTRQASPDIGRMIHAKFAGRMVTN